MLIHRARSVHKQFVQAPNEQSGVKVEQGGIMASMMQLELANSRTHDTLIMGESRRDFLSSVAMAASMSRGASHFRSVRSAP
jgi:hypothetical protein